jgi:hypothetical protein
MKYNEPILVDSDDDLLDQDLNPDHLKLKRPEFARKRRKVDKVEVAADTRRAARARMERLENSRVHPPT